MPTTDKLEAIGNFGRYQIDLKKQRWAPSANLRKMLDLPADRNFPIRHFYELVQRDQAQKLKRKIRYCKKTGKDFQAYYSCLGPSGKEIFVCNRGRIFRNRKNSSIRIEGVIMDLSYARSDLQTASPLKKTKMISRKSHDLKTSVSTILLATELIQTGNKPQRDEALQLVKQACKKINQTIAELEKVKKLEGR